jgi:two-component system, sensor histidine kinase YesM
MGMKIVIKLQLPKLKSFKWKLITMTFTIIIFIVTSIGFFSYFETSRTIQKDVVDFSTQILKQANLNLERYLKEYEQGFFNIASSADFLAWISVDAGEVGELSTTYLKVEDKYIRPFVSMHPEIMSITIYNINGNEKHFTNENHHLLNIGYSIKQEPWLKYINLSNNISMFVNWSENYSTLTLADKLKLPVMTMVKKYRFLGSAEVFIKMDISLEPIQTILKEIKLNENGLGMIIDGDGKIIAHTDFEKILDNINSSTFYKIKENSSGSFLKKSPAEMVVFRSIANSSWKSVTVVPYKGVAKSIYRVRDATLIIAFVSLLLALFLVIGVSSSISKGIINLRNTIAKTKLGNFSVRVEVKGEDEIADLGQAYNNMLQHAEDSIYKLTETKLMQQEAVMSALQSQINSHFLYNALESINSMACLADHKEIEQTTLALSNMLRYTSNYMNTMVTISDEINHLRDYLHIMGILYGDSLTFDINVDEDINEHFCLKAVMQPMVENSIKHGVETTGEPIHISVKVERHSDKYIRILIEDNGKGFDVDRLEKLQYQLNSQDIEQGYKKLSRIGLLNVNYRLKVFYRDTNAGVQIQNSGENGGAIIRIVFPVEEEVGHE